MDNDLRERDLDIVLVKETLDLAVKYSGCLVDVFLIDSCADLEDNAAV